MRAKIIFLAILTAISRIASARAEDGGQQVLRDGFDGKDFAPAGHLYYRNNAEQKAGTYQFQSAVSRSGGGALKLTIKPNCAAGKENCSERAEIWEKPNTASPMIKASGTGLRSSSPIRYHQETIVT